MKRVFALMLSVALLAGAAMAEESVETQVEAPAALSETTQVEAENAEKTQLIAEFTPEVTEAPAPEAEAPAEEEAPAETPEGGETIPEDETIPDATDVQEIPSEGVEPHAEIRLVDEKTVYDGDHIGLRLWLFGYDGAQYSVQWQVWSAEDQDWVNLEGETDDTLWLDVTAEMNGTQYRVVVTIL